jgi:uncharacterized protein YndB with AHSA1/START domain
MTKTNFAAPPNSQSIVLTRHFDAPPALVYKTFTDPALIPHWWGPARLTTVVDKMDARPGGSWRFVQRDSSGQEFAFHGVYHDCQPARQTVSTFEFEGLPGHVLMETVTFEASGGGTLLTNTSVFQSQADRDGMLSSGMESGATESMDRMAAILAGLAGR